MKSHIRVFRECGMSARGKILPYSECRLFSDLAEHRINDEMGAYFVQEAEKMLTEEIPLLPLSLYRDKFLTGIRSRFEKFHHRRRTMLLYMSIAEAYERKGRFTEKIADILWAILEETGWVIPAHFYNSVIDPSTTVPEVYEESQVPGLDLYAANCCATVALCRYLLKDELDAISPVICRRVDHLVWLRGVRPFIVATYGWSGEFGEFVCNWVTNITNSILFATAVTVQDTDIRTRVAERAMKFLDNFTSYYPEDGCCDEGPGYWGGAGANYFDCLEILEDMSGGKISVYNHPLVRKIGEYIANFHIDGKYYLNFADAHPRLEQDGKLIMRYGKKCASEDLYSFGEMVAAGNPVSRYHFFGMAYRVLKDACIPEVHEAQRKKAKKQLWYEGNKIAIFRESEDTSKGLYLAVKGGHNHEAHNHNDVGCFVVYANGQPVIVDPSHGSYDNGFFGPTRYDRWFMKSSYHSIPLANGIEQKAGDDFASSEEVYDAENASLSMELKNAFPPEAGLVSMKRTCSLRDGTVSVEDTVKLEKEGTIQFNYVTLDEPKKLSENSYELSEGKIFTFCGEGLEAVIEKVENVTLPLDDLNFRSVWGRECLWRICLKAKAAEKTAVVTIR